MSYVQTKSTNDFLEISAGWLAAWLASWLADLLACLSGCLDFLAVCQEIDCDNN